MGYQKYTIQGSVLQLRDRESFLRGPQFRRLFSVEYEVCSLFRLSLFLVFGKLVL